MDDDDNGADESAYDLGEVRAKREPEPITMPTSSAIVESSEPAPDWAKKWQSEKKMPAKIKGSCAKWNVGKGFGFIKRDDGMPDVYVHQRDVQKSGFRSLLEGERVEFDIDAMDDGRLHAVRVTGPNGADVQGQPHKSKKDDDDDDDVDEIGGRPRKKPKPDASTADATDAAATVAPAAKPFAKPAFLPRAVAKPKPVVKPKPKPAPS